RAAALLCDAAFYHSDLRGRRPAGVAGQSARVDGGRSSSIATEPAHVTDATGVLRQCRAAAADAGDFIHAKQPAASGPVPEGAAEEVGRRIARECCLTSTPCVTR